MTIKKGPEQLYRELEGKAEPLRGLGIGQITELARYIGHPYGSYGKLRAYTDATGKLPPVTGESGNLGGGQVQMKKMYKNG